MQTYFVPGSWIRTWIDQDDSLHKCTGSLFYQADKESLFISYESKALKQLEQSYIAGFDRSAGSQALKHDLGKLQRFH
jgi:hypothetical protein